MTKEQEKLKNSSPKKLSADCRLPPFTSPRNLLCLGFLGTTPLTIPSYHPHSQEAKSLFTAASCLFFAL